MKRDRITPVSGVRAPDIEYLAQIAKAAEQLGFEAVLTPTGTWCEDAWAHQVALAQHTERLNFLVAFRPGVISPVLAAQMAATYQRITRGRLLLNVVTGGDSTEPHRDQLDHDRRYARTAEFLSVVRGAWSGQPYDFDGEHYQVEGGLTALPPDPLPEIFFGGCRWPPARWRPRTPMSI
ncbi:LLM class flavin-dependent oxidoreductase OS=Streptomyces microflavus OX=1919 GN=G3I39_35905 PE=4 SV=1 [Streptomyces microflavus]